MRPAGPPGNPASFRALKDGRLSPGVFNRCRRLQSATVGGGACQGLGTQRTLASHFVHMLPPRPTLSITHIVSLAITHIVSVVDYLYASELRRRGGRVFRDGRSVQPLCCGRVSTRLRVHMIWPSQIFPSHVFVVSRVRFVCVLSIVPLPESPMWLDRA